MRCNFRKAKVQRWTGAAYSDIGAIDLASGLSGLTYTLTGRVLSVDTGTVQNATQYLYPHELKGATVKMDDGIGALREHPAGGDARCLSRPDFT